MRLGVVLDAISWVLVQLTPARERLFSTLEDVHFCWGKSLVLWEDTILVHMSVLLFNTVGDTIITVEGDPNHFGFFLQCLEFLSTMT